MIEAVQMLAGVAEELAPKGWKVNCIERAAATDSLIVIWDTGVAGDTKFVTTSIDRDETELGRGHLWRLVRLRLFELRRDVQNGQLAKRMKRIFT